MVFNVNMASEDSLHHVVCTYKKEKLLSAIHEVTYLFQKWVNNSEPVMNDC